MEKITVTTIKILFASMMSSLLFLLMFFQNENYACKKTFLISNLAILLCYAVLLLLTVISAYKMSKYRRRLENINWDRIVKAITACLFLGQLYVSYNIIFYTGWDVEYILSTSKALAFGEPVESFSYYYSKYPNNLLLVLVQSICLKINRAVGIFEGDRQFMCIVFLNCVLSSLSCFLIYKIAGFYLSKKFAFAGFISGILTFGISPWMVICYSDALGLIFPVLCFYFYAKPARTERRRMIHWCIAVLTACIGYCVKPQCFIILPALLAVELAANIRRRNLKNLAAIGCVIVLAVVSFFGVQKALIQICERNGFAIDSEMKFGASHFFMMGLNEKTGGVYFHEDVQFSESFDNVEERTAANLARSKERLQNMGTLGLIKHGAKKLLTAYNDGTYAWGAEGRFYFEVYEAPNQRMASFLRSIYYNDGSRYPCFATLEQFIWIGVLIAAFFSVFFGGDNRHHKEIAVLMVSVIGLTLFEVLFEARARYLYTYLPIFCILAAVGCRNINFLIKQKCQSICFPKKRAV